MKKNFLFAILCLCFVSLIAQSKHNHNFFTVYATSEGKYVKWLLTKDNVNCQNAIKRKEANAKFEDCQDVNQISQYKRSGYDRGHLFPAGDAKCLTLSEYKSTFNSCNIAPQEPNFNRIEWMNLERFTRKKLYNTDSIEIIAGVSNFVDIKGLLVPSLFFRMVYEKQNKRRTCWIFPNEKGDNDFTNNVVDCSKVLVFLKN